LLWAYNPVQNKDQKHPNMSLFRWCSFRICNFIG
jgi:hypothetical protein